MRSLAAVKPIMRSQAMAGPRPSSRKPGGVPVSIRQGSHLAPRGKSPGSGRRRPKANQSSPYCSTTPLPFIIRPLSFVPCHSAPSIQTYCQGLILGQRADGSAPPRAGPRWRVRHRESGLRERAEIAGRRMPEKPGRNAEKKGRSPRKEGRLAGGTSDRQRVSL
jgi:hypothetical protein